MMIYLLGRLPFLDIAVDEPVLAIPVGGPDWLLIGIIAGVVVIAAVAVALIARSVKKNKK